MFIYLFDVYTHLDSLILYVDRHLYYVYLLDYVAGHIKHSETSFGERFPLGTVAVYKV